MKYRALSLAVALATLIFLTTLTPAYAQDSSGAVAQQGNSRAISPEELAARAASGKPLADADRSELLGPVVNLQTAVACSTCYTCGGDWPIWSGATHAVNTGSLTYERGGGCSGALAAANDSNPYLCCR